MRELPFPVVTLAELTALSPKQTLVLTVNNRLARTLTGKLAETVQEGAAELLKIEPWTSWLTNQVIERLYAGDESGFSQVLDSQTTRLVWAEAIAQFEAERSLIDMDQVAAIAADADALLLNWQMDVSPAWRTPDYNRFLSWRKAYESRLTKLNAIDLPRVPGHVVSWIRAGALALPKHVVLMGFTDVSVSMRLVLDAMVAGGVRISQLNLLEAQTGQMVSKVSLATPEQQWSAAVAWARRHLLAQPRGRFAIVVPTLQNEATEARRLLERELDGFAYNVAVAPSLAQWPQARAMLNWLRLLVEFCQHGRVEPALAGQALLAGGCAGSESEAGARAMLDARWRHQQRLVVTHADWQDEIRTMPKLFDAWQHACALWQTLAGKRLSWFQWANGFRAVLAALEFPGEGTQSSVQYQTVAAIDQLMSALAVLDDCMEPQEAVKAWQMLSRLARQTLFQPQRDPNARLDVLGLLEAEGGRWDGVWIMGVTDDVLPAVVSPNPLIPIQALTQAGAPRSTAQREYEWAAELMQALRRAGDEVVFSWAERDGEQPNRPSPFLAHLPLAILPTDSDEVTVPTLVATQTWLDEPDIAVTPDETIRGGVTVLQTQAANPMWAFFQHRLSARGLPAHAQWPATFDRGNFLHRVLQLLWQQWGDQAHMLKNIAKPDWPGELRDLIGRVAADKLGQWPQALRELEEQRGFDVISAWLVFESQREPFKVVEREGEHQFIEGALSLRLTIDRIDELASGQRVVFDYKSGSKLPEPARDWQSMALRHAQLLVYASVLSDEGRNVDALAWIWLHAAGVKVKGLAAEEIGIAGVQALAEQQWADLDWNEQLKRWEMRVRALAAQFAAGEHENRFWHRDDLKYCTIQPLLRVHAQLDDE